MCLINEMQMPPLSLAVTPGGRGGLARFISRAKRCLSSFFLGPTRVNSIGPAPNSTEETFLMCFPRQENLFTNEKITYKHQKEEELKVEIKCEVEEKVKAEEEEKVQSEWDKDAMRLKKEMLDEVIEGLKEEGEDVRRELNKLEEEVTRELENLEEQVMQGVRKEEELQGLGIELAEQVKLELKDWDWLVKQKKELGQEENKLRKKIRLSMEVMKEQKQEMSLYMNELDERLIPEKRWMSELKKQGEQQQQHQQQISEKKTKLEDLNLAELKELEEKVMQRLYDLDWHVKRKMNVKEETEAEKRMKMMAVTEVAKNR